MGRRWRKLRGVGTALAIGMASGCGPGGDLDPTTAGPVVRDSAGVRITENGALREATWHVGSTPIYSVGWASGDPSFTWLQAGRILPDGDALVADQREGTMYVLGPDGSVQATWGRQGQGPGEYQRFDALALIGDTVFVTDTRNQRVTTVGPGGEVLKTDPATVSFLHSGRSFLPDGRLLMVPGNGYSGAGDSRPEWAFQEQPVVAWSRVDGSVDTLASLPHTFMWYGERAPVPGLVSVNGRAGGRNDGFVWGRADIPELRQFDADGRVVALVRWGEEPVPVTPAYKDSLIRMVEDQAIENGAPMERVRPQLELFDRLLDDFPYDRPYWDTLLVDSEGNVWMRHFDRPRLFSDRWTVVDRDGRLVGVVTVPDIVEILDISEDRILGVSFDDFDVPAAVLLELVKP